MKIGGGAKEGRFSPLGLETYLPEGGSFEGEEW